MNFFGAYFLERNIIYHLPMKTIMHLHTINPAPSKKLDFDILIEKLAAKFNPLQIINFSRHSFAQNSNGCFKEEIDSQYCNYCLLLITESGTRIDHDVQDFVNTHYHHGTITVICHCKKAITEAIAGNNRFFIKACTEGEVLYQSEEVFLVGEVPSFDPVLAADKAREHFKHRFSLAEGFYLGANECLGNWEQYNICAFMLHQAVEQLCIGLIRVHLGYRSEFHNLNRLLRLCTSFSEEPLALFTETAEDMRLFNLLCKSYSAARYNAGFKVSEEEAYALCDMVTEFMEVFKRLCEEKIGELEGEREGVVAFG
jgi:HEPN domain-containing protein